ncbi:MAG: ATP synthase F1 subunit epsilon [Thermoanaerobaculia bacterium]
MAEPTFHLSIVTPERVVLETEARSVVLPAYDGQLGILAHRAPLLARLGAGRLTVETASGEEVYFVDGGFAQMVDNRLTVLTEQARRPEDLDRAAARQALEAALALPATDETAQTAKARAIASARARLRLAP